MDKSLRGIRWVLHMDEACFIIYIIIYQHISFASATIISASYNNTNNIKIIAQNLYLKPLELVQFVTEY